MSDINCSNMSGNLTVDPVMKYTDKGIPFCIMRMASSHYINKDKKDVCFINVVMWGARAESCAQYLKKGSLIMVSGRLRMREAKKAQGVETITYNTYEIKAEEIKFTFKPKEPTEE